MYVSGGGCYRPTMIAAWRAKLKRERETRIEQFAEMLAEGYTVSGAANALGVTQQAGSLMLKTIRERLGPQAV